ncbi:MAG: HD domain-containing protein [Rickettsiaceae bacterium]
MDNTIVALYTPYTADLDVKMLKKAMNLASKHNVQENQGVEYVCPFKVSEIVARLGLDSNSIISAMIFNIIETENLYEDVLAIKLNFSDDIAELILEIHSLSQVELLLFPSYDETACQILALRNHDKRALIIKLAARLERMRTIHHITNSVYKTNIALQTVKLYAPLAERIGLHSIATELQDLCLQVIAHNAWQNILEQLQHMRIEQANLIIQVTNDLYKTLGKKIRYFEIYGRQKTPYSIWKKMQRKNLQLDQLRDIVAFRIIVDKVEDCYTALGLVHNLYHMIPKHFKDFISKPKNNGYRSLHTIVLCPMGNVIEIQIRTREMHETAEHGQAAHWRYKNGILDNEKIQNYDRIRNAITDAKKNKVCNQNIDQKSNT